MLRVKSLNILKSRKKNQLAIINRGCRPTPVGRQIALQDKKAFCYFLATKSRRKN
jgi:hypothetical protein